MAGECSGLQALNSKNDSSNLDRSDELIEIIKFLLAVLVLDARLPL